MLKRSMVLAGVFCLAAWAVVADEPYNPIPSDAWSGCDFPEFEQNLAPDAGVSLAEEGQVTPAVCCKICTTGKACGNSCINRSYDCHQPPGCACDGITPDPSEAEPDI